MKAVSITRAILLAFWLILALFIAITFLDTPLRQSSKTTQLLLSVLPEGWGFFTRNPREARVLIWKYDGNQWKCYDQSNFTMVNLGGIKRTPRIIGMELAMLVNNIDKSQWIECTKEINELLTDTALVPVRVKNRFYHKSLTGRVIIQLIDPIPWAWSQSQNIIMPSKIAFLNVE
jgi:antimicrobial peptide system SdpA family protein